MATFFRVWEVVCPLFFFAPYFWSGVLLWELVGLVRAGSRVRPGKGVVL